MKTTLIQLISEQTMQNLLPVIALKPARLVHLITPKVAERSAWIVNAARYAGLNVAPQNKRLSEMPTIQETAGATLQAIKEACDAGELPVVNFTGGTKLMSIGAYAAAAKEKVVAFYVDTEHVRFVDAAHGGAAVDGLLNGDFSLARHGRELTINTVALANGCNARAQGRNPAPLMDLAQYLLGNRADEMALWSAILGPQGLCPNGHEPRKMPEWRALAERPLNLPPNVAELCLANGLLRKDRADRLMLPADPSQAKDSVTILGGGWWEIAVYDAIKQSGFFQELMWSANFGGGTAGGRLEEDVIGFDGMQILYVSCKRGGNRTRILPLLEEINMRAERIGGRFVHKALAIYNRPADPKLMRDLESRARQLHIRVLNGQEIADPQAFLF